MLEPFSPVTPFFFAMGNVDAESFVAKHGAPWTNPHLASLGEKSRHYLCVWKKDSHYLSFGQQMELALTFLIEQRDALVELQGTADVRRLCLQRDHAFSGSNTAIAELISPYIMVALGKLDIELGVHVSLKHESIWE